MDTIKGPNMVKAFEIEKFIFFVLLLKFCYGYGYLVVGSISSDRSRETLRD